MFSAEQTTTLHEILRSQPIGALGTLHRGEPFVSMVPIAILPEAGTFIIHVSSLASHTKDMIECAAVSLMITAANQAQSLPQSMPRATFQCQAQPCSEDQTHYETAKSCYVARFPQSEKMFSFGDFSLFQLVPRYMRFVGGFAQATSVMAPELKNILAHVSSAA